MSLFGRPPRGDDSAAGREYLNRANGYLRKSLLVFAAINQIIKLPIASKKYFGRPLADTFGLQSASDVVREVLVQDASMAAWTARDSLVTLDALLDTMDVPWNDALDIAMDAAGLLPGPQLNPERLADIPLRVHDDMRGLANCVAAVFFSFERPGGVQIGDRAYYEHLFQSPTRATQLVAHEITAWSGVVIGRLLDAGHVEEVLWMSKEFETVPAMKVAGWYPNPWRMGEIVRGDAGFQRQWNGADWTDQIRLRDGRGWRHETNSMFKAPAN